MKLLILPRSAVQGRKTTRVFLEDGTELENVSLLSVGYYNDVSELDVLELRRAILSTPEKLKSIALEFSEPTLVEIAEPPAKRAKIAAKITEEQAVSLTHRINDVIDSWDYVRVEDDGDIVLDGRFTMDQLRRIVQIIETAER